MRLYVGGHDERQLFRRAWGGTRDGGRRDGGRRDEGNDAPIAQVELAREVARAPVQA